MKSLVDPIDVAIAKLDKATKEKAAIDSATHCPACGKVMQNVNSRGVPATACLEHRIVLPRLEG